MGLVFCTKSFQTFLSLTRCFQFLNLVSTSHFPPRLFFGRLLVLTPGRLQSVIFLTSSI
jgi:hypothetical protein